MNVFNKVTAFKQALALAAVLSMSGTALAKNGNNGVNGDLSSDRTQVTVALNELPACTSPTTGSLSVYIFQSVGRLVNIGTYSGSVACTGSPTDLPDITVTAVPGLTFPPGPATLLIRYTTTTTDVGATTTTQTHSDSVPDSIFIKPTS